MITIRVRSSKGTSRIEVEDSFKLEDLWDRVEIKFGIERNGHEISLDPSGKNVLSGESTPLSAFGLKHGDMVYIVQSFIPQKRAPESEPDVLNGFRSAHRPSEMMKSNHKIGHSKFEPETLPPTHQPIDDEMIASLAAAGFNPDGTPMLREPDTRRYSKLLGPDSDEERRNAIPRGFHAEVQRAHSAALAAEGMDASTSDISGSDDESRISDRDLAHALGYDVAEMWRLGHLTRSDLMQQVIEAERNVISESAADLSQAKKKTGHKNASRKSVSSKSDELFPNYTHEPLLAPGRVYRAVPVANHIHPMTGNQTTLVSKETMVDGNSRAKKLSSFSPPTRLPKGFHRGLDHADTGSIDDFKSLGEDDDPVFQAILAQSMEDALSKNAGLPPLPPCLACGDRPESTNLPCGHRSCETCSRVMDICPVCYKEV